MQFVYNGDGQRVRVASRREKSVVNGETILFIDGHFEVLNPGTGQTVTKYYFAGASIFPSTVKRSVIQ